MAVKLSSFGKIFSIMYSDTVDITRSVETKNEYGATVTTKTNVPPLYTNVACRVSFAGRESPKDYSVDSTPVKYEPKIFCEKTVDILVGDQLKVSRLDDDGSVLEVYYGVAGLPTKYPTHQEILFYMQGEA